VLDKSIPNRNVQFQKLWGVVREFTGNPLLVKFLAELIEEHDVPERNPVALVKAIQNYAIDHIKFFREYPERFQSPLRTIDWGIGDCDDKTIFVACCTRTFRIPTHLSILELKHPDLDLAHVYPECFIDGLWVPVETVRRYPWGHNPAQVAIRKNILIAQKFVGDKAPSDSRYG
jgi:hypothetical protein